MSGAGIMEVLSRKFGIYKSSTGYNGNGDKEIELPNEYWEN